MFSIWYTSSATAALPIDSIGCLTVVRRAAAPGHLGLAAGGQAVRTSRKVAAKASGSPV